LAISTLSSPVVSLRPALDPIAMLSEPDAFADSAS